MSRRTSALGWFPTSHLLGWAFALFVCLPGCATTRNTDTARTGLEQLLISNAVDQAIARIDFKPLNGKKVFVEERYLDGVDKNYVIASIRQGILVGGAHLVTVADQADVIIEVRNGGLGTDRVDTFVGSPQLNVPGPIPLAIPEVKVMSRTTQIGTAKIGLIAYDAKTREAWGAGGSALARSADHKWYMLGAGPYNSGSIRDEVGKATGENAVPLPFIENIGLLNPPVKQGAVPVVFESGPSNDEDEEEEASKVIHAQAEQPADKDKPPTERIASPAAN